MLLLIPFLLSTYLWAADCSNCQGHVTYPPLIDSSDWPDELIKVHKEEYERNEQLDYCKRPPEMIDTVVIHHSQTPSTDTAQDMNRIHLGRGWYMVGYSYAINSPYPGQTRPSPKVTEARPLDLVGAHAGSNIFVPMDPEQQRMWDEGKITCGFTGQEFSIDPTMVKDGKIKANVTTIGMVIIGNYTPFSLSNPDGYRSRSPRNPTKETLIMAAKMSCQLQKKYPRIKYLKWHNYYHDTTCPGTLKNFIGEIRKLAKDYGCEFK